MDTRLRTNLRLPAVLIAALPLFAACAPLDELDGEAASELVGKLGERSRHEAEDRSSDRSCKKASRHNGYTGSGYMDFGGNGSRIEWNDVRTTAAGQYELSFRYANGSGSNRRAAVLINGQQAEVVPFAPTGGWASWRTVDATVSLRSGNNTITVQANSGSGGPNLDHMDVEAVDLCPSDPNKREPGECGCGTPEGNCNDDGGGGDVVQSAECGLGDENATVSLRCDEGATITAIDFASYGTPSGTCDNGFATSSCHAGSSQQVVESACLGKQSCQVQARNSVFGDPCSGTRKRLAVGYSCGGGNTGGGNNTQQGLLRRHYSGSWSALPDFDALSADAEAVTSDVSVGPYAGTERFGLVFTGYLQVDRGGNHEFEIGSDDGSRLLIDGAVVVDNDGLHGYETGTGSVGLITGRHRVRVEFFERSGGERLTLRYRRSSGSFAELPANMLSHDAEDGGGGGNDGPVDECPGDPNKTTPGECGCGVPEGNCGDPTITASGEYVAAGEVKENAFDGDDRTKWLVKSDSAWIQYDFPGDVSRRATQYAITSANDAQERDPRDWRLRGSNDGRNFVTLDERSGETFTGRFQRRLYVVSNPGSYRMYRLDIRANGGASSIQLAEIEWLEGAITDQCPSDPNKVEPGSCGCGTPDTDSDGDGLANCIDQCPSDRDKQQPGRCGCGVPESDCGMGDVTLEKADGTTLRVAAYNVLRDSVFDGARRDAFARMAPAVDADIWCMQEVSYTGSEAPTSEGNQWRDRMEEITGEDWEYAWDRVGRYTLSRFPVLWDDELRHRVHVAWIDLPSSVGSSDLVVVNLHLAPGNKDQTRRDQAAAAVDFVNDVLDGGRNTSRGRIPSNATIVVCGDFNAGPTSGPYKLVESLDTRFKSQSHNSNYTPQMTDWLPTHLGTDDERATHGSVRFSNGTWDVKGSTIDHILVRSNGLRALNGFILNTLILAPEELQDIGLRQRDVAISPSGSVNMNNDSVSHDHLPIILDLGRR